MGYYERRKAWTEAEDAIILESRNTPQATFVGTVNRIASELGIARACYEVRERWETLEREFDVLLRQARILAEVREAEITERLQVPLLINRNILIVPATTLDPDGPPEARKVYHKPVVPESLSKWRSRQPMPEGTDQWHPAPEQPAPEPEPEPYRPPKRAPIPAVGMARPNAGAQKPVPDNSAAKAKLKDQSRPERVVSKPSRFYSVAW